MEYHTSYWWKHPSAYAKRNLAICRDRERGMTYKEIAKKYNLCQERIRQIVAKGALDER